MTASQLRGGGENLRQLVVFAEANGWMVSRTRGGHIRFTKPGLGSIYTSSTASDYRAGLNAKARLRRAERAMPQSIQEEY
ncbi:type II toxin-antitoxin system HicA family toxin [Pseudomonas fluorescens]|uniref:Type II toxin-antitoxin system HicA family toxin n=1 Tax=Pseudomonas fluorescens TaxID=294 RepID=A0A4Y9TG89_PSEFL|nr:type II toxin-antitoxin system HicA family toxin [Pseudomonas fluorescens]TFW43111.1 type II toxin-antitoxin system HicA family toxin [Pseudomonas fluorescens]